MFGARAASDLPPEPVFRFIISASYFTSSFYSDVNTHLSQQADTTWYSLGLDHRIYIGFSNVEVFMVTRTRFLKLEAKVIFFPG